MPRNYYCDFCQCTFPDNVTNRRNHFQGNTHVSNRKLHYDWYKDPKVFLQEQIDKPPCNRFLTQGQCEFGLLCKYSHITLDQTTGQPVYSPELLQWFQLQQASYNNSQIKMAAAQQTQATESDNKKKTRYKLPSGWKVKDLPPSLKPPPSKHGYDWNQVGSWD